MADDEIPDKTAADDLDPAFDSIDATMTNLPPRKVSVTPAALAQIVNDAVAKAITAYEQARTEPAEPARGGVAPRESSKPTGPQTPWRAKLEQLQGDMGIGDIEFDGPPAEPEKIIHRQLSAQMGVHDFEFEDAPGAAAQPDAPTRTDADALAGWATPVPNAAPAAMPDVNQTLAPAAAEQIADVAEKFDWIAAELEALGAGTDAKPLAAPPAIAPGITPVIEPAPKPAPDQTPKAVAPAVVAPPAPKQVAPKPVPPKPVALEQPKPVTPKEEVRETRSTLASWFRSALADKPQEREQKPAAAMPVAKPAAPTTPVAPPAPAPVPVVTAPPPIVQPPAAEAKPAPDQAAPARPVTPEEATNTIVFTFDPFPPVPPRLPREPKDAPND